MHIFLWNWCSSWVSRISSCCSWNQHFLTTPIKGVGVCRRRPLAFLSYWRISNNNQYKTQSTYIDNMPLCQYGKYFASFFFYLINKCRFMQYLSMRMTLTDLLLFSSKITFVMCYGRYKLCELRFLCYDYVYKEMRKINDIWCIHMHIFISITSWICH